MDRSPWVPMGPPSVPMGSPWVPLAPNGAPMDPQGIPMGPPMGWERGQKKMLKVSKQIVDP